MLIVKCLKCGKSYDINILQTTCLCPCGGALDVTSNPSPGGSFWEGVLKWLWPGKITHQLFILGMSGLLLLIGAVATGKLHFSPQKGYRYPAPPAKCRCQSCGFVLEMTGPYAGKHCPEVPCPKCGSRMWRLR